MGASLMMRVSVVFFVVLQHADLSHVFVLHLFLLAGALLALRGSRARESLAQQLGHASVHLGGELDLELYDEVSMLVHFLVEWHALAFNREERVWLNDLP